MNKLNHYTFWTEYDQNNAILYNSFNGSIILIEKRHLYENFKNLDMNDVKILENLEFFLDKETIQNQIIESYKSSNETLNLIVEFTQKCNLRCPYCYQSAWGRMSDISKEHLDDLYEYAKNCFKKQKYKKCRLSIFGGEPIVAKENVIYGYEKIKKLCKNNEIEFSAAITTNGILLDSSFIDFFEKLFISITLTSREDHDRKRKMLNGQSSFEAVVNNIKSIIGLIKSKKVTLSLRYNVDHSNINDFRKFIEFISAISTDIIVEVAYLEEFESSNGFKNLLSMNDFRRWNSSEAIDILISNGLRVHAQPKIIRFPCHGYTDHNIKIYSNGSIGLCNADFLWEKDLKIKDIKNNIDMVSEVFLEKKSKNSLDQECLNCKDFLLCGGKLFCRKKKCDYGLIDLSIFLKTYVKYVNKGQEDLFMFNKITNGA